jgi:hypothetical protein
LFQQLSESLYVSADVRTNEATDFLRTTASLDILSDAVTALVAPKQYDCGKAAIMSLKEGNHLDRHLPAVDHWNSVWSGFALIVNRETPFHRDMGGAPSDYDFLLSGGTHTECFLDVRELGLKLRYLPGTGIAIAGRVLRHGVGDWSGGERICQAMFIKDSVHNRLGQPRPSWVLHGDYFAQS